MITKHNKAILSSAIALMAVCQSSAQSLDAFSDFNLITRGDAAINSGSEVEGRTLIGGSLTSANSTQFGFRLNQNPSAADVVPTLIVSGDIVSGSTINVTGGSVVVGGEVLGRRAINIQNSQNIRDNNGDLVLVTTQNTGATFDDTFNELALASSQLATLASSSGNNVTTDGAGNVSLNIASATDGLTVFNVDESIFGLGAPQERSVFLNGLGSNTVVINVSSGDDGVIDTRHSFGNGFIGSAENILFNFYDATEVNIGDQFFGSILAPNAEINATQTIDGSIFADSLRTNAEIHLPNFDGDITLEQVPEPSSTLLLGLGGLGLLVRRKR